MSENQLHQKMAFLRSKVILMGLSVSLSLERIKSILDQNDEELSRQILADEKNIDSLDNEIDELALEIMVRFQPVAYDLRFVVSVMRMILDLERIGDEISCIVSRLSANELINHGDIADFCRPLLQKAFQMYSQAMESFSNNNPKLALQVLTENTACRGLEEELLSRIINFQLPLDLDQTTANKKKMASVLICHSLSRICQRSANIAEHTVFISQGVSLKHGQPG